MALSMPSQAHGVALAGRAGLARRPLTRLCSGPARTPLAGPGSEHRLAVRTRAQASPGQAKSQKTGPARMDRIIELVFHFAGCRNRYISGPPARLPHLPRALRRECVFVPMRALPVLVHGIGALPGPHDRLYGRHGGLPRPAVGRDANLPQPPCQLCLRARMEAVVRVGWVPGRQGGSSHRSRVPPPRLGLPRRRHVVRVGPFHPRADRERQVPSGGGRRLQ